MRCCMLAIQTMGNATSSVDVVEDPVGVLKWKNRLQLKSGKLEISNLHQAWLLWTPRFHSTHSVHSENEQHLVLSDSSQALPLLDWRLRRLQNESASRPNPRLGCMVLGPSLVAFGLQKVVAGMGWLPILEAHGILGLSRLAHRLFLPFLQAVALRSQGQSPDCTQLTLSPLGSQTQKYSTHKHTIWDFPISPKSSEMAHSPPAAQQSRRHRLRSWLLASTQSLTESIKHAFETLAHHNCFFAITLELSFALILLFFEFVRFLFGIALVGQRIPQVAGSNSNCRGLCLD